jgi:dihydroxyacid dehydratase/phosphogluconate dehydratase
VDSNSVLVLRHAGPVTGPGMPEWGNLPIPAKLLKDGVTDMIRISDARMSGTHFGACILHVSPESYPGSPLSLVEDGDFIEVDVLAGIIRLDVTDSELSSRRYLQNEMLKDQNSQSSIRGYAMLYKEHVEQSDLGCDFDFLRGYTPLDKPKIF